MFVKTGYRVGFGVRAHLSNTACRQESYKGGEPRQHLGRHRRSGIQTTAYISMFRRATQNKKPWACKRVTSCSLYAHVNRWYCRPIPFPHCRVCGVAVRLPTRMTNLEDTISSHKPGLCSCVGPSSRPGTGSPDSDTVAARSLSSNGPRSPSPSPVETDVRGGLCYSRV